MSSDSLSELIVSSYSTGILMSICYNLRKLMSCRLRSHKIREVLSLPFLPMAIELHVQYVSMTRQIREAFDFGLAKQ